MEWKASAFATNASETPISFAAVEAACSPRVRSNDLAGRGRMHLDGIEYRAGPVPDHLFEQQTGTIQSGRYLRGRLAPFTALLAGALGAEFTNSDEPGVKIKRAKRKADPRHFGPSSSSGAK
jgi:hypothetical protein